MLLEVSYRAVAYKDDTKQDKYFDEITPVTEINGFDWAGGIKFKIPASAVDYLLWIGYYVNSGFVLLQSESAFQVKFNDIANTALDVKPRINTQTGVILPAFIMVTADNPAQIFINNLSTIDIYLDAYAVGVSV